MIPGAAELCMAVALQVLLQAIVLPATIRLLPATIRLSKILCHLFSLLFLRLNPLFQERTHAIEHFLFLLELSGLQRAEQSIPTRFPNRSIDKPHAIARRGREPLEQIASVRFRLQQTFRLLGIVRDRL